MDRRVIDRKNGSFDKSRLGPREHRDRGKIEKWRNDFGDREYFDADRDGVSKAQAPKMGGWLAAVRTNRRKPWNEPTPSKDDDFRPLRNSRDEDEEFEDTLQICTSPVSSILSNGRSDKEPGRDSPGDGTNDFNNARKENHRGTAQKLQTEMNRFEKRSNSCATGSCVWRQRYGLVEKQLQEEIDRHIDTKRHLADSKREHDELKSKNDELEQTIATLKNQLESGPGAIAIHQSGFEYSNAETGWVYDPNQMSAMQDSAVYGQTSSGGVPTWEPESAGFFIPPDFTRPPPPLFNVLTLGEEPVSQSETGRLRRHLLPVPTASRKRKSRWQE